MKPSAFLEARFGKLDASGKFWMWAGLITLVCSMGMAYDYGSQVTFKHGAVMAALSFATAFLLEEAYSFWKKGLTGVALGLTIISVPMFWQEGKSHIAYTAGYRGASVESVHVQNTKYNSTVAAESEEKAAYDMMAKRFAELNAQNGWAATMTADAERAKLPGLELAIQLESKRGGCKQVCETKTKERDAVNSRIAVLEERSALQQKLEAARAYLDKRREKVAGTEHKSSVVEHQTNTLIRIASLFSTGDAKTNAAIQEGVDLENTIGLALMPVILPALCFFMMGLRRKDDPAGNDTAAPRPARDHGSAPSGLHVITKTVDHTDHATKDALSRLRQCIQAAA